MMEPVTWKRDASSYYLSNRGDDDEYDFKEVRSYNGFLPSTSKYTLITFPSVCHKYGGRIYNTYHIHPLILLFFVLFLILYIIKFTRVYFHNASIQAALIDQGEPRSCLEYTKPYHHFHVDSNTNEAYIPSFGDAAGAFWSLVGYSRRSNECEEWHKKIKEWNIPDPSDIAWLVITSSFTQPIHFLVEGLSITIETFFSKQSMLVTVLIFGLIAYICKLHFLGNVTTYRWQ